MVIGIGALGQLYLAEHNGARVLEPTHDRCVFTGTKIAMKNGAGCRRDALGPEKILQRNRHAMQRAAIPAMCDFGVRGFRLGNSRLCHHVNVATEFTIQGVDTVELRARHVQRGDVARLKTCGELCELEIVQCVGHGSRLHSCRSIPKRFDTGISNILVFLAVNQ